MMGNKNKKRSYSEMEYNHNMTVHRVRFFLSQHWSEDDICTAMHIPMVKVRELIREVQLRDGTYELV